MALQLCGAATDAAAACVLSSDNLIKTCSGDIIGAESFNHSDDDPSTAYSLIFKALTSQTMQGGSPTLQFNSTGKTPGGHASGIAASNLTLEFNTDAAVKGFNINSASAPTIQLKGIGGNGGSHGENSGTGDRTGGNGGEGGSGAGIHIALTEVNIAASPGLPFVVASNGGTAGNGRENYSTGFGDGIGGDGGVGGHSQTIDLTLNNVSISNLNGGDAPVVGLHSSGGKSGNGGEGKAADYTSRGGSGGAGPHSDGIYTTLQGSLTIDGANATGITITAQGGQGGNGGEGFNTLSNNGHGGVGGIGGDGGSMSLTATDAGAVTINASGSGALIMQSLASDGGNGGHGGSDSGEGLGGDGGQGGTGGTVTVSLPDKALKISTTGDAAQGVFARSYGGAGGNGGSGSSTFNQGKGGSAAGSGPGGNISLTLSGDITTKGSESNAIVTHSVGGFAGDGGSGSGFVAYGGGSESAGAGGTVTVDWGNSSGNQSVLTTEGSDADALFAQSLGGGGGKGGSSSGIKGVGGSGSAGGDGMAVVVDTSGSAIKTSAERSRGIFAQSAGGGGGDGGSARAIDSIGGAGSKGGAGSTVNVTNSSSISTGGDFSSGLFAQSVGGGGGSAASSSGIVAIGGNGGSGGASGRVTVANKGDITTTGMHAPALVAQSVGLGGGHGGSTAAIGVGFSLAVGGKGGTGGTGGDIIVQETTSAPMLKTSGDHSTGFMAQSVGGGGGHGGSAVSISAGEAIDVGIALSGSGGGAGDGGTVDVAFNGGITTAGDHSIGLMATSTGGAGGSAGTSLSLGTAETSVNIAVGGSGGGGGTGEHVTVCRGQFEGTTENCAAAAAVKAKAIATLGDVAHGLLAASGGGGGGHSGATISGSALSISSLNVSAGGSGGAGGDGHDVIVYSSGGITTKGDNAYGILAESYGGTGGAAFASVTASNSVTADVGVSIGGKGGAAGHADLASVTSTDTISTSGKNADGIAALSVAGSGGAGGVSIAGDTVTGGNVGIAIGGKGGGGATSGSVVVDYLGTSIETKGTQSVGIMAASVAGSGGRGGMDVDGSVAAIGSVEVAVGGAGGNGGSSNTVTVTNQSGSITTGGSQAPAISASSHGGAGGRGGASISSTVVSQGSANITIGGGGGNGGTSGVVTVTNGGTLQTNSTYSEGLFAQSHGGSGGAGGFVVEGGINAGEFDGDPAGNLTVSVGGSGGIGGVSGAVDVVNTGAITTGDYKSTGLFAQSIGGQGGAGGSVYTGTANVNTETSYDVAVNVGGSGGAGGAGAPVSVTNGNGITTKTAQSHALFAQSVGGNGGVGGSSYNVLLNIQTTQQTANSLQVTVGGSGGEGAVASTVMVSNSGSLNTVAGGSAGIYAQSVGGNGGAGGSAGNILINAGKAPANSETTIRRSIQIDVGGSGGTGAHADAVSVVNQGSITTKGQSADAIFAQSVGGGGGDGGSASGYNLSVTGKCSLATGVFVYSCRQPNGGKASTTYAFTANIGGSGGAGGNGEKVSIDNTGAITTNDTASHGIFAHSIGGGGGTGGSASDNLAAFTTSKIASTITNIIRGSTANPYALITKYTSFQLSIGGKGGAAGNGEAVDIGNAAKIITKGASSYGVHAQSIGGGGGAGGAASASLVYSLSVGGLGSGGGDGGAVTVSNNDAGALISTSGDNSIGIFAQSVGDGGGAGGDVGVILGQKWGVLKVGVGVGVKTVGGVGGNGGAIQVNTGDVTTTGKLAHGVFAHSVGGSGGALGYIDADNTPQGWAGNAGDDGKGGDVTIDVDGKIDVSGEQANGVFAQSAGGADEQLTTNTGGAVTIDVSGGVSATGSGARAILAQSEGGSSNGQVLITVQKDATVVSSEAAEVTIGILDGDKNIVNNAGTISKPEGATVTGYAVRSQDGLLTINNSGTLAGSLLLDGSNFDHRFNNKSGGLFESGREVNLGSKGTLSNDGVLSPGGTGVIVTSALTGAMTQSSKGQYNVDLVPVSNNGDAAQVDSIVLSNTADLAGSVKANIEVTSSSASGTQTTPAIVTAIGGISADTKSNLTIVPSVAANYQLTYPNANEIAISYDIDWASDTILGATRANYDSVAVHMQGLFAAGQLDPLVAKSLIDIETTAEYARFADLISPEIYANTQLSTLYSSLAFTDSLMSCAVAGGAYKFVRQGQCGWFRAGAGRLDQDDNERSVGFEEKSWVIAGGTQHAIDDDWSIGWSGSYEHKDLSQPNNAQSDGEQYQLGLVVKRRVDAAMFSASLSGGYGDYSVERDLPDTSSGGDQELWNAAAQMRAAYTFGSEEWYVTPRLDAGIDWVATDEIDEQDGGYFSAVLNDDSQVYYHVQLAVEGGGELALSDQRVLRMELSLGVTRFIGDATPSVSGRFSSSPLSVDGFEVESKFDRTYLDVAARIELLNNNNLSLSLSGFSSVSSSTNRYGGEFRMAIPF